MRSALPCVLLALLLGGGCAATDSTPKKEALPPTEMAVPLLGKGRETIVTATKFRIARGMTAAQLREANGEPAAVQPMQSPTGKAEVWTYRRPAGTVVRQVVTRMDEVPYMDPLTGVQRMVKEPVYGQERHNLTEQIEVLLFDGLVLEAKRSVLQATSFN